MDTPQEEDFDKEKIHFSISSKCNPINEIRIWPQREMHINARGK